MYGSMVALFRSIENRFDAMERAQMSVALSGFPLIMAILNRSQEWSATNYAWTLQFFVATLAINQDDEDGKYVQDPIVVPDDPFAFTVNGKGPSMGIIASQINARKTADQYQAKQEIRRLTQLAEQIKAEADQYGSALSNVLGEAAPIWSLLNLVQVLMKNI